MNQSEQPSYSELMHIVENSPKDIMPRCIRGLTLYAAELRQRYGEAPEFDKSEDIRELIQNIAMYWNLDDNTEEIARQRFIEPFDGVLEEAILCEEPLPESAELMLSAIFGLYRFAEDLTNTQGTDAADQIEALMETMREVADLWGFSADRVEELCDMIESRLDMPGYIQS